uniref:Uncharacterized protein n=1 Tax=Nymphaea colorata TaxID=210225 RepID=A0A5K1EQL3_9MAGN|nr:unnamed protein product [Nymphaea colorata]
MFTTLIRMRQNFAHHLKTSASLEDSLLVVPALWSQPYLLQVQFC